ncbi:MAG: prephenate dehydratase, partial [Acidobacteriota bacterium]|nr:prephenate dehydratase [Acidobacteriota bacterium]
MKRRRQEVLAFQGERGAFSEEAARKLLGQGVRVLPCQRFEDLFRNLKEGRVTGAVVPIENTLAGSVHENYDHLVNFELPIVAETSVRIVHNLIAPKGVRFSKIRR